MLPIQVVHLGHAVQLSHGFLAVPKGQTQQRDTDVIIVLATYTTGY